MQMIVPDYNHDGVGSNCGFTARVSPCSANMNGLLRKLPISVSNAHNCEHSSFTVYGMRSMRWYQRLFYVAREDSIALICLAKIFSPVIFNGEAATHPLRWSGPFLGFPKEKLVVSEAFRAVMARQIHLLHSWRKFLESPYEKAISFLACFVCLRVRQAQLSQCWWQVLLMSARKLRLPYLHHWRSEGSWYQSM